eukprot:5404048-Prymnesium_polylepis.1
MAARRAECIAEVVRAPSGLHYAVARMFGASHPIASWDARSACNLASTGVCVVVEATHGGLSWTRGGTKKKLLPPTKPVVHAVNTAAAVASCEAHKLADGKRGVAAMPVAMILLPSLATGYTLAGYAFSTSAGTDWATMD